MPEKLCQFCDHVELCTPEYHFFPLRDRRLPDTDGCRRGYLPVEQQPDTMERGESCPRYARS